MPNTQRGDARHRQRTPPHSADTSLRLAACGTAPSRPATTVPPKRITAKQRVEHILDAIDAELAQCDIRQLGALQHYALTRTTTNCSVAHYWLRPFLIEYVELELAARRIAARRGDA